MCPFCKKFYDTFTEQVLPHYGDRLKFVVYHQVQPWQGSVTLVTPSRTYVLSKLSCYVPRKPRLIKKTPRETRAQLQMLVRGMPD